VLAVHLIKVTGVAGAERHLLALLPALRERGVDARLVVLADPGGHAAGLIAAAQARGVPVGSVRILADGDVSLFARLSHLLRGLGPAIVHTHLIHADVYGIPAARLAGVPAVVTTRHNDDAFRRRWPVRVVNRALWRRVQAGIAVSAAVSRFSVDVEGAEREKLAVIHHGLDLADYRHERDTIRRALGCNPDGLLVGMIGRLTEQKGIAHGLEAFAAIGGRIPGAQLVIVGDGPLRERLIARAKALGLANRARFLGWRDDAARLMAGLDVFLMPSLWEGFGIVLLEAMAQATAIVASDAGAIPEIVEHGQSALLAPPRDAYGLADHLRTLLEDGSTRARIGQAGRTRLLERFTVDRMVTETLALYKRLAPQTQKGVAGEMRRLRIMAVIARLNVGGPAVNVLQTAARLDPASFETRVVCGRVAPEEGDMSYLAHSLGVQPIVIRQLGPALCPWNDLISLVRLHRLMRRMRPDVVHTHTAKAGFVGRLAAHVAGVPVVVHTYHGHVLRGYFGPLKGRIFLGLERWAARWSQCVLTLTEALRCELAETLRVTTADRIRVMPLGLDLAPFTATVRQAGRFRASIGVATGVPLIGIVGRLAPVKDHDLFVRAAAEVVRREAAARFVVVGDGALRGSVERQVAALGLGTAFIFTGWRRDMPAVYSDLDVTVISSRNEGTPVTAIEALASGCPVVATAVGGVPELLEHGRLGRLVASREAADLAAAILAELAHPAALGPERSVLAARHSLEAHAQAIGALYRGLLGQEPGHGACRAGRGGI